MQARADPSPRRRAASKHPAQEHCMKRVAEQIGGYDYGAPEVARSPVTLEELQALKLTVGWTSEDDRYRQLAGEVLEDQVRALVDLWRVQIIGSIPHLSRHSRTPEGRPIPEYSARSGLRFQQWVLDTCLRPYDQAWLDYQHEIARRHMDGRKNQVDHVQSTPFVPFRDIIAFVPVMNETIRPFLAAKGHSAIEVEKMHRAWIKSLQLQIALWAKPYSELGAGPDQW
jgi:hypothetical protein